MQAILPDLWGTVRAWEKEAVLSKGEESGPYLWHVRGRKNRHVNDNWLHDGLNREAWLGVP
jgi:hypothetical protein